MQANNKEVNTRFKNVCWYKSVQDALTDHDVCFQWFFCKVDGSFVIDTMWVGKKLFTNFGRVSEKDYEWLLMHELSHYLFDEKNRYIDNFGMPRDDEERNPITGITLSESVEIEKLVVKKYSYLSNYLNDYSKERFLNFKP